MQHILVNRLFHYKFSIHDVEILKRDRNAKIHFFNWFYINYFHSRFFFYLYLFIFIFFYLYLEYLECFKQKFKKELYMQTLFADQKIIFLFISFKEWRAKFAESGHRMAYLERIICRNNSVIKWVLLILLFNLGQCRSFLSLQRRFSIFHIVQ